MRSSPPRSSATRIIVALAASAALFAPLALSKLRPMQYPDRVEGVPNPDGYAGLATAIRRTGTLAWPEGTPTALREPGYPVALAAAFTLMGVEYQSAVALNALLLCGSVLLIAAIGTRLFGSPVGALAAWISALYPPFLYYSTRTMREVMLVFMGSLLLYAVLHFRPAVVAVIAAAAALTNTTFVPFSAGIVPIFLAWRRTRGGAVVYLLLFLSLYSLWPLRNYMRFGTLVIGSTAGAGTIFYTNQILEPEQTGTPEEPAILHADPVFFEGASIADGLAREKYFWKAGWAKVFERPGSYLRKMLWRFADLWRVLPRERGYDHDTKLVRLVALLSDGWILPLGLLGLALTRLRPLEIRVLPLFILALHLPVAMVFSSLRYRVPAMPAVIVLCAYALWRLSGDRKRRA